MDKSTLLKYMEEQSKTFTEALGKESDRALGIIAVCWLDHLLKRLIRASYIKDPQVRLLFEDDHILQTFFSKVNIAYFSGLIPKFMYHDLRIIGKIRNIFAHKPVADLEFSDESIKQRISSCVLRPKTLNNVKMPKTKFIIIVTQVGALLTFLENTLSQQRLPKLMDVFNLDQMPFEEIALTKAELIKIITSGVKPPLFKSSKRKDC